MAHCCILSIDLDKNAGQWNREINNIRLWKHLGFVEPFKNLLYILKVGCLTAIVNTPFSPVASRLLCIWFMCDSFLRVLSGRCAKSESREPLCDRAVIILGQYWSAGAFSQCHLTSSSMTLCKQLHPRVSEMCLCLALGGQVDRKAHQTCMIYISMHLKMYSTRF